MTPDKMHASELEPGDLVFMGPASGDPLGAMIRKYDRSVYSHVGIVAPDPGYVVSARMGLARGDLTGVRHDPLTYFQPRPLGGAKIVGPAASAKQQTSELATCRAENLPASVRCGEPQDSGFSFLKLLSVAAALNAKSTADELPDDARDRIFTAAWNAARALAGTPAYFCAEFVTTMYGLSFTTGEFDPPPDPPARGEVKTPSRRKLSANFVDRAFIAVARTTAFFLEQPNGLQQRAVEHLLRTLDQYDEEFLVETARMIAKAAGFQLGGVFGLDAGQPPDESSPLPAGLVTPRMLAQERCFVDEPRELLIPEVSIDQTPLQA